MDENDIKNKDDELLEVIGILLGIILGLVIFIVFSPVFFAALIIASIFFSIKKIKWLTYSSVIAGLLFLLVGYLNSFLELIQYIPIPLKLFGFGDYVTKAEQLLNNGQPFHLSFTSYVLMLSLSFVLARFLIAVYQFYKGKIVKPKEDTINEFRESKEYKKIFNKRFKLNEYHQKMYRKKSKKKLNDLGKVNDVLLGIDEYGKASYMDLKEATQHITLQGTTGSGKTIVTYSLVEATLMNKEPVFFIDGKGDPKTIKQLQSMCDYYGRKLHVFSENTKLKYNPFRNGNRTSITDRIMVAFDWSNEFYKNESENQLQKVIHFLDDFNIKRDIENITYYMSLPRIYDVLSGDFTVKEEIIEKKVLKQKQNENVSETSGSSVDILNLFEGTEESQEGSSSEEEYEIVKETIQTKFQSERSKKYMQYFFGKNILSSEEEEALHVGEDETSKMFRGMQSQLEKLLYSDLGHLLDDSEDGIDLMDIINKGESVIFSFNSLSYPEFLKRFARFVISDISNAVQSQFGNDDNTGVLGIFDEFGAYGSNAIVNIVARARSANFRAVIGVQSFGDFVINGADISQQVIDNTNTFIFGKSNSSESPEKAAGILGTYKDKDITHQTENKGTFFKRIDFKADKGTSREVNKYHVHPDQIKKFTIGEFAVLRKAGDERPEPKIVYFRNPLEGLEKGR